jgi:hypothetical protein
MQPKILPALFFFLLGLSTAVAAQRRVAQFEAFTDTEELFLDSYLELNLVLRNGEGTDFSPPDLKDFRILSGPSRGVSTTVINGQVDMEMRFSYTLQPRRLGKLQIGAASIKVNNRTLRTRPISISVIQGSKQKKGAGAGEEYFVRAELNKSQAYVGEQVRLDYKLYTRVEIQNYNMVEESGYLDFYAEDFQRIDGQVRKEILSGREYYTRILKSLALYPQKAGVLRIEPASLQLGILVGDPSESFFFGGDIRRAAVLTEAVELRVAPVPGNAPVSFSGAVGDFSMSSILNRNTATTDDMLTLQMTIVGDGDLKRIEAPVLSVGDSFEVYEARVMEETYSEEANRRVGRKVFEYMLTPKVSGTYSLRPQFSYFSPAQNQFVTLSDQVFDLTIRPGSRKSPFDPGSLPGKTGQALQPLKQVQTLKKGGKPLLEQPLFLTFLFLPFFLAGAVLVTGKTRRSEKWSEAEQQKKRRQVALEQLKEAARHKDGKDSRAFYQAISNGIIKYAAQRLQIPLAQQTREEILRRLAERGMDEQQIGEIKTIFQQCEMALYAGQAKAEHINETYDQALHLLETLERVLGKR